MKTLTPFLTPPHWSPRQLALAALLAVSPLAALAQAPDPVPVQSRIMHLTRDQRRQMIAAHLAAPQINAPLAASQLPAPQGTVTSVSLLAHVPYNPAQRNQATCGDCWQWSGTGVMEVAHDVQMGIFDRLSVQFINSCDSQIGCCGGGWLSDLASFYSTTKKYALPWSNDNADWSSGGGTCSQTPCSSIAKSPQYPITSISVPTVKTWGVGQAQAIANIKSRLDNNKAVWFAFYLPTAAAWSSFDGFWSKKAGSVLWTNFYCGQLWDNYGGGHAVLCVGYYDDSAANRYWIMLNSWGVTPDRPDGLFRVGMDLDYDCQDHAGDYMTFWESLNITFTPTNAAPLASDPFANATARNGTAYAVGANLSGQTNAAGQDWCQVGPGTGPQPKIAAGSLCYPGLAPSSGNCVSFGGNGTSARLNLGATFTCGTLYYSFVIKLTDITTLNTTCPFWAGFSNTGGSASATPTLNAACLGAVANAAGGYNLSLLKATDGGGANLVVPTVFTTNDVIFVVASYQFNSIAGTTNDVARLWINPDPSTFGSDPPPAATLTNSIGVNRIQIASFVLFDRLDAEPAGILADELRVGASWGSVTPPSGTCTLTIGAVSSKNVTGCYGNANGSITVSASGGTSPLQFSDDGGNTWNSGTSPYTFSNLPAGNYVIQVQDASTCTTGYGTVTISQPAAVTISSVTHNNVTCNGGANGSLTVAASGGTGTLQYTKDGGATWQTSAIFSGLASGTYSIVVRDANLCTATYGAVTITQPSAVAISSVASLNASCGGRSDGSLTVTAAGGTGALQFSDNGGANWNAGTSPYPFTNLPAGNYSIAVKDANGCTASYGGNPVAITQPTASVTISAVTATNVTGCYGGTNGSITVTASGTGALQFSDDGGASWNIGASPYTFSGLPAGSYVIEVQDDGGCTFYPTNPVTITQPAALTITSVSPNNISCNGGVNGSITVAASGGTGALQFSKDNGVSWSAGASPYTFSSLTAGSYNLQVQDANGCTASYGGNPVTLIQPSPVEATLTSPANTNRSVGQPVTFTVGASGTAPLYYQWRKDQAAIVGANGASYAIGSVAMGDAAGSPGYDCVVTNVCDASTSGPVVLTVALGSSASVVTSSGNPSLPGAGVVFTNTVTAVAPATNVPTGVVVFLAGGVPLSTNALNGSGVAVSDSTTLLPHGSNTVTAQWVGDSNLAGVANRLVQVVNTPPTVLGTNVSALKNRAVVLACASLLANARDPDAGDTLSLVAAGPSSTNGPANNVVLNAGAGTITYTPVSDYAGADSFTYTISDNYGGTAVGTVYLTLAPVLYSIDNGVNWQSSETFSGLGGGSYTITVKDANGCTASYSGNPVIVADPPALTISSIASNNPACNGCANGSITVTASGGTGALQFSDSRGATWVSGSSPCTFANLAAGYYELQVTDANGCTVSYSGNPVILIEPAPPTTITLASAPTYDSANGTFRVAFAGASNCVYTIEYAPAVTGPWSYLKAATAGADGQFEVEDTVLPALSQRFYRARYSLILN